MKKRIVSALIVIAIILSLYYIKINFYNETPEMVTDYSQLKAHFIDVGQGDSCFIELPNGENMLIDSGESKYADTVTNYISELGYSSIDYLVATHGDSDHIGSLYKVFEEFDIKSCYTSVTPSKTKTYQKFCDAVDAEGIELKKPLSNEMLIDEQYLDVKVVGPDKEYKDTNDASVVLLVSFYEYDFLFTGDAPYEVLENYNIGDIEVLKASHHGSRTGVSDELIEELSPEYSVISAGKDNKYGHPHAETLKLLSQSEIYITAECGDIVAVCSSKSIIFSTEKEY